MNLLPEPHIQRRRTATAQRLLHQRNKLLRARAALVEQIKRLTEDASEDVPEYSIHMADAGTDSFYRDLNLGLASFEQEALYEVDADFTLPSRDKPAPDIWHDARSSAPAPTRQRSPVSQDGD